MSDSAKTIIHKLSEHGQSIWCDNISRHMIDSGELLRLIDLGIVGVTSNPSILMKAVTGGNDYDALLRKLAGEGKDTKAIYEGLVMPDIADAADILKPVYDRSGGLDGYVSLEVSPRLADDTEGTIAEARRLFAALNRPNVMIKVPATNAGMPAVETLIADGINVNVTLIFSLSAYRQVMQAYIGGLSKRREAGQRIDHVASVASFFVSRLDSAIDKQLQGCIEAGKDVSAMLGKMAVANTKLAYAAYEEVFLGDTPFASLAAAGAKVQRPLWASTSTKDPSYPDTLYVDNFIGPDTVNTLPPVTIEAVLDHGRTETSIHEGLTEAKALPAQLAEVGIDLDEVTDKLRDEGVAAFAHSFDELLANIEQKRAQLDAD